LQYAPPPCVACVGLHDLPRGRLHAVNMILEVREMRGRCYTRLCPDVAKLK